MTERLRDVQLDVVNDLVGLERLAALVRTDAGGMAEFGGFYGSAVDNLGPLLNDDRRVWLIRSQGDPVGFIDADRDGSRVGLAYFVIEQQRGQGVTRAAVRQLLHLQPWGEKVTYTVAVSGRNVASIGVARATGFTYVGRNDYDESVWDRAASELE